MLLISQITTPDLLSSMYKILYLDNLEKMLDIGEDEGPEGSQEGGSEQRGRYVPNDEDDSKEDDDAGEDVDEDEDNGEDEEELKLRRMRIARRRISRIYRKRPNNRVSTIKKHDDGKKMKERTKRAIIKSKIHNKKQRQGRTVNDKINYNVEKPRKWTLKLKNKKAFHPINDEGSTKIKSVGNSEKKKDTNNDLYFEMNEGNSGNNDANEKENDSETNINIDKNISRNGDHEWDDEDGSGSGDRKWDDEDGSGDSDDDESGDDNNESGDSEERRKEVEESRKTYAEYILNVSISLSEARGVPIPRERLTKDNADMIKFQIEMMEVT